MPGALATIASVMPCTSVELAGIRAARIDQHVKLFAAQAAGHVDDAHGGDLRSRRPDRGASGFGIEHHIGQVLQPQIRHRRVARLRQQVRRVIDHGTRNGFGRPRSRRAARMGRQSACSPSLLSGQMSVAWRCSTTWPLTSGVEASIASSANVPTRQAAAPCCSPNRIIASVPSSVRLTAKSRWPQQTGQFLGQHRQRPITSDPLQRSNSGSHWLVTVSPSLCIRADRPSKRSGGAGQRWWPALAAAVVHGDGSDR